MTWTKRTLSECRVLIVDDVETSRIILRSFCKKAGLQHIKEAINGAEALAIIHEWQPDMVLLDMEMPVMDGLTLCHTLRNSGKGDDTIIVMQTGSEKAEAKALAFEAGVTDLITKPLVARETIARITAHLERRLLTEAIAADYKRIQEELREAVIMQSVLLPNEEELEALRIRTGLDITYYYHPTSELAGDYLTVRALGADTVAIATVDVSGHGITAALYAFTIHAMLESLLQHNATPEAALHALNTKLHSLMREGKFATMFLGYINTHTKQLTYASAAAPPPVLISGGKATTLASHGTVLGIDSHVSLSSHTLSCAPGDVLFLYSDALTETPNAEGRCWHPRDIATRIEALHTKPSAEIVRSMMEAFYGECASPPRDDVSMLACRF